MGENNTTHWKENAVPTLTNHVIFKEKGTKDNKTTHQTNEKVENMDSNEHYAG